MKMNLKTLAVTSAVLMIAVMATVPNAAAAGEEDNAEICVMVDKFDIVVYGPVHVTNDKDIKVICILNETTTQ